MADSIANQLRAALGNDVAEQMRTQDNACTSHPLFLVQERVRDIGFDVDCSDDRITWLDVSDCYVEVCDDDERRQLDAEFERTYQEPEGFIRTGYRDRWEFVAQFFLRRNAEQYIDQCGHRHRGKLSLYVDSAHRNHEACAIRAALLAAREGDSDGKQEG